MKPLTGDKPRVQSEAQNFEDLADQIHRSFLRLENGETPDSIHTEAARAFDRHYRQYLALGGKPFQFAEDWLQNLILLEERCRVHLPADRPDRLTGSRNGEWSKPMKKAEIRKALGLDSYYALSQLAERGVYQLRQDPTNRQRWTIRLDTLDPETRRKFDRM